MRNAELGDFVATLQADHARKLDVVAPAEQIKADNGRIKLYGVEPIISDDGVTMADGLYLPTRVFDEGISAKLGIPLTYVRRLRDEAPALWDANVNSWLHGWGSGDATPDQRSFLLRLFKGNEGQGIARAFLSNSYELGLDNLDVLVAALDGVRQAGVDVVIDGCDLTDRKMYVRVVAPQVQVMAEELLKDYRNPLADVERWRQVADREGMGYGGEEPIIFAGFQISNSEVGNGAFSIVPRMVIKVCKNGLVINQDMLRAVHVGSKMDAGVVRWSQDTQEKNAALITAKARDAVATFLDADYMAKVIAGLTDKAGQGVAEPETEVRRITKALNFDQATQDGVLGHFIRGGQMTRGGVMNAITSYAQTVEDADKAADLEASALTALSLR